MILLDTHVLVWLSEGSEKLGKSARARLLSAEPGDIKISAITFWEIAMLVQKGRLVLDRDMDEWFEEALELSLAETVSIDKQIAVAGVNMPGSFHPDPADRFIVSTARLLNFDLMTADQAILNYAKLGHLSAIDASV